MSEDLVKAMEALAEAARNAGLAARVVKTERPEPVKAGQSDQFECVDRDGDHMSVVPGPLDGEHSLSMRGTTGAYLNQDAVNGLAQYLDRYRTDQPKAVAAPDVDLNAFYCAGYDSEQPPRKSGCGHPRRAHGALGCNAVTGCPCERRNGS